MILIIDNYDSFTYNLVQVIESLGYRTTVHLNDTLSIDAIRDMAPEAIVLSPGPCTPNEAGICLDVVGQLHREFPILGVCLGHQVIGAAFGASIVRAPQIMHGKIDQIMHSGHRMFETVPDAFEATRYHSLIIDRKTTSQELEVLALSCSDSEIMAIAHRDYPVFGLQFHPESIATPHGRKIIESFLAIAHEKGGTPS